MAEIGIKAMIACLVLMSSQFANPATLTSGRSVQFDPGFGYYQNRSAESVAREIEVNGYKVVRYIVTNDDSIRDDLIAAFHKRGMKVWYQTFGNGFYGNPPKALPAEWPEWKPKFIGIDQNEGYTFLSLSHPDYRAWKANQILSVIAKHKFDGVEIAEPFQMGWYGPEKGLYGDVCPSAVEAFKNRSTFDGPPDFKDPSSSKWYKTDTARYRTWSDFRVSEVNAYLKHLCDALKAKHPKMPFSVWMLANTSPEAGRDPAELIREWQGVDSVSMAKTVKPDLVCFQTNWPDWSNPVLPGDYPKLYATFITPLRKACPKVPIIVQADTGSLREMRRSRQWIELFESTCEKLGVGSTYYMYDISRWQYTEKPQVKAVEAHGNKLLLVFQKCIEPSLANELDRIKASPTAEVISAKVDGNLLTIEFGRLRKGTSYTLTIKGLCDDKKRRLYSEFPAQSADISVKFVP